MVNRNLRLGHTVPIIALDLAKIAPYGQSLRVTCQFGAGGLKKGTLTVKGSGCVALGHPVTFASVWLPEKDDGSEADATFEPLRRHALRYVLRALAAADAKCRRCP